MEAKGYMMLSIKNNCDSCGASLIESPFYEPRGTRRGVKVYSCNVCGLTQSAYGCVYVSRPAGNMSADADRSSLRYTKTLVADSYKEIIDKFIGNDILAILDIGSNRGVFARYALEHFPHCLIHCIEPDENVIDYSHEERIQVENNRFEFVELKNNHYDFVYSVHTFEHLSSASEALKKVFSALANKGKFLLAVPRLVMFSDSIEELFIDPHTYHFTRDTLRRLVLEAGFNIDFENQESDADIIFVLSKSSRSVKLEPIEASPLFDFKEYDRILTHNRKTVAHDVERINDALKIGDVLIWGAGRIFNALLNFGNLQPHPKLFIHDKYLSTVVNEISGFELSPLEYISTLSRDSTTVYVASRDYKNEIIDECSKIGFSKFIVFGEG